MAGMCFEPASQSDVTPSMPRPAPGRAIDPVRLEPVDEVVITTLVDNVYDALLVDDGRSPGHRSAPDVQQPPSSRRDRRPSVCGRSTDSLRW